MRGDFIEYFFFTCVMARVGDRECDVDDDSLGPLGLHWSDVTVLKGVNGPTRLLYSSRGIEW